MTFDEVAVGANVTFKPGPRSTNEITARVTAKIDGWLFTKADDGVERKVRAGRVRAA